MMDEKKLEQEYKKLKRQAAPDLWDRIEGNLKEHPEREQKSEEAEKVVQLAERKRRPVYGMAAAAAAILVLVSVQPVMKQRMEQRPETANMEMAVTACEAAAAAAGAADGEQEAAEESAGPGAIAGAAADGDQAKAESAADGESPQQRPEAEAQVALGEVPGASTKGQTENGLVSDAQSPEQRTSGQEQSGAAAQVQIQRAALEALSASSMAYRLEIPENALTVSEDARYFSESILGDTELLCGATVVSAQLEQDEFGRAVKVSYQMTVERVEYAEDYIAPMDTVTVKSPIISTEGDESYVLYQLIPGNTYLLPLVQKEGCFELLYPFAPQIQVTEDQEYVFHSGYASLISPDTSVTVKEQEGTNDYYYDRMLVRTDDNFLSDLIALIEREAR